MADSKGSDGLFMLLFVMAVVMLVNWGAWKLFRPQLTEGIFAIRALETKIASIWMSDDDIIAVPMFDEKKKENEPIHAELGTNKDVTWTDARYGTWKKFIQTATPADVQDEHFHVVNYITLYPMRWFFAGIFIIMAIWVVFTGPTSRYRRTMGLEALMHEQAKMFPVIRPFLKFNPNKLPARPPGSVVPTELPMFAEALNPEEWIAVNEIEMKGNQIDRAAAEAALAKQLGPRWKGPNALPNELKVLLAAFCLKAARKRTESDDMLGHLMACWDHKGGMKLSRNRSLLRQARKILRDKKLSEKVLLACNRHTYVSTALIRALDTARNDGGVLASSQFLWLRAHNRQLWYPLNNLGRDAYHIEALGVMAHYRSEKQLNRPIPRPNVAHAVEGIDDLMKDPIFARPVPQVDYGPKGKNADGKKSKTKKAA